MTGELTRAERSHARGRDDEALLLLWNAVEPVRLSGDERARERLRRLAAEIAREGGGEARDAERLLAALAREDELRGVPAVVAAGGAVADAPAPELEEDDEAEEPAQRGSRIGSLLVFAATVLFVVVNIVRGVLGDE
jgi:hypothetical protein